jgi:putative transposase
MAAAAIRTIFAQPSAAQVREQPGVIAGMLGRQFPTGRADAARRRRRHHRVRRLPVAHWKKIRGTNPLELNKEVKRRTDVVGVFPNPEALLRLAGSVLAEAHDEWQAGDRRYLSEGSISLLATRTSEPKEVATPRAPHGMISTSPLTRPR